MTTSPRPASFDRIGQFRGTLLSSKPIHPLEKTLIGAITVNLSFLAWDLGGMRYQAQLISFCLSAVTLVLSLITRDYSEKYASQGSFRLVMWGKLRKFPIFWVGLAFLIYTLIQCCNPALRYEMTARGWWMERIPHIAWLPHSVTNTPLAMMTPWRALMVYFSAWATACAIWVGFTRRKSITLLLTFLVINGMLLGLLALAEKVTHATRIFWLVPSPAGNFVGPFIYKNHAGAYFNLILAVCAGMGLMYYLKGQRRLEKSNPSALFFFLSIIMTFVVIISYSRAATILCLIYLFAFTAGFIYHQLTNENNSRNYLIIGSVAALFIMFLGIGLYFLDVGAAFLHMERLFTEDHSISVGARETAARATWQMASDNVPFGVGAGSFRFVFPEYQIKHQSIVGGADSLRLFWEHAHNDYAEFSSEFGIVGVGLLLFGFALVCFEMLRLNAYRSPLAIAILPGLFLALTHSWIDFLAYCPAILVTWLALWATLLQLGVLEDNRPSSFATRIG